MSDDECTCEFDPYEDEPEWYPSFHYRRVCEACGNVWWGLHCIHDGVQNPCPKCGVNPFGRPSPLEHLGLI